MLTIAERAKDFIVPVTPLLYHGTLQDNEKQIRLTGFKPSYGRWGTGVYLGNDEDYARCYGTNIIKAIVEPNQILYLKFQDIAKKWNLSVEEEEGLPELETYVKEKGYQAVLIEYKPSDYEVCIYDTNLITILE